MISVQRAALQMLYSQSATQYTNLSLVKWAVKVNLGYNSG